MPSIILAFLVIAVAVIAYVVYKRRKAGCKTSSDCPAGQVCVNGACQAAPPVPPTSCYQWTSWNPATEKGTPSWLISPQAQGYMVPVGAQVAGGWSLGATVGSPLADDYGQFMSMGDTSAAAGGILYGVKATGTCPTAFQSTTDPTKALQFHGTPVCWDFSDTSHAFTPYAGGACSDWGGMGTFQLVQDASA
jgi:hypothetical protein